MVITIVCPDDWGDFASAPTSAAGSLISVGLGGILKAQVSIDQP